MYIVISIGNTDNKLSQNDWAHYVEGIDYVIEALVHRVHYFGGSPNWYPWQNVAWIAEITPDDIEAITSKITAIRKQFELDSAMVMIGSAKFI